MFYSQLSDGNWGDFIQSILSYDGFKGFNRHVFFDESAHAKADDKGESDDNDQIGHFYRAFQSGFVQVKSSGLEMFKQGFDLEPAFVIMTGFVSQFHVCEQEQGFSVSLSVPEHPVCQR